VEELMEAAVIRNTDKVIAINEAIRKRFAEKYSDQPAEKFVRLQHGFDPDDFQGLHLKHMSTFTIAYVGSLYGRRNPNSFLRAIKELISEHPEMKENLLVKFVGSVGIARKISRKYSLNRVVEVSGHVPHRKALEMLCSSHVALLITGNVEEELTGKIVEYVASGIPILALTSDNSSAGKMVKSTKTGLVISPDDIYGIKKAILHFYSLYKRGELKVEPNNREINKFDIRKLTRRLSEIFNEVI